MKLTVQQLESKASLTPPTLVMLDACAICASSLYDVYSCPSGAQFVEIAEESANVTQGYLNQGNNQFANNYNPGWRKASGFK